MKHYFILGYAALLELLRILLCKTTGTMNLLYVPGARFRLFNGKARAYAEFAKAYNRVPAYRQFLNAHHFRRPSFSGIVPNMHEIPATDKENYVRSYSIENRCINGQIPCKNVVIDESAGSSGTATNWVRGKKERLKNAGVIRFVLQKLLGNQPLFIINAFALGPWATGVNVTMSCLRFAKLKSIGPDKTKIENTLKHFGKEHQYVIMGYPPFLKLLVDNADIEWSAYNVVLIFGGESMSEELRTHLTGKGIRKVYSSLGATDLELNLAAENDFTISLRKLLQTNQALKEKLLKHTGALPMIFQYNPADFLFETSVEGELIVTICRAGYLAPKIRYNIHDRGHTLSLNELYRTLKSLGISTQNLVKPLTDLPLLLHYGRSDMTVSFFGANIAPADIQEVIYKIPALAAITNSFSLQAAEDNNGNKQLKVSMELQQGIPCNTSNALLQDDFFEQLAIINQDFREAKKMTDNGAQTQIRFYPFGEGVFKNNDIKIKNQYIG